MIIAWEEESNYDAARALIYVAQLVNASDSHSTVSSPKFASRHVCAKFHVSAWKFNPPHMQIHEWTNQKQHHV
jgi:hypothetical protein